MPVNMNELLDDAAGATSKFLNTVLPSLTTGDWWDRRVLQFLSRGQRSVVDRNGITRLEELDLAALLHTLDNNWHSLDDIHEFSPGAFNFVKEMRVVRNRWSHKSATPDYVPDDVYRDLDTLGRFLAVIDAENRLLEKVRRERLILAGEILQAHSPGVEDETESPDAPAGQVTAPEESASPSCPVCGNDMVMRTARTGPYPGSQFWGCSDWSVTGCNGIINIPKSRDTNSEPTPTCPVCQSSMVLRTARNGPYAGSRFWGCGEWGITGCNGLINIQQDPNNGVDDLPF